MKKISLVLVVLLMLVLSGCGEDSQYTEPPQDDWPFTVKYAFCSKNGNYSEPYCVEFWNEYDANEGRSLDTYYTQEEVDELLEDYVSLEELNELFSDEVEIDNAEEFMDALDDWIEDVESRLDELEKDTN